jgi:hypothetical protein
MPIDPRHGRFVPAGARLGRTLAVVLRHWGVRARAAVLEGREPNLMGLDAALFAAARAALPLYWRAGEIQGRRDAATLGRRRPARKHLALAYAAKKIPDAPVPNPPQAGAVSAAFDVLDPNTEAAVRRLALDLAGGVGATTRAAVRSELLAGLEAGEGVDSLADRLEEFFAPRRAYRIAASEASRATAAAQQQTVGELAQETGMKAFAVWMASSDACKPCLNLDGTRVELGMPFHIHTQGRAAYRVVTHPPLHPRCGCAVTYEFDDG